MRRIPALDALRGVLAVLVLVHHVCEALGTDVLHLPARLAVLGFFAMSGYVLCRAWDGSYVGFLARRAVRLWPVYATCLAVGGLMIGRLPGALELVWWPGSEQVAAIADPPTWSLFVEAGATLALPVAFLAARWETTSLALLAGALAMAATGDERGLWALAFAVGVCATRARIAWPECVPAWSLWLGRVSYSLYLSHWLVLVTCVLVFGPVWGPILTVPLAFPAAWVLWACVEQPSIGWSRRLPRALEWRVPA